MIVEEKAVITASLESHLSVGNCEYEVDKVSLSDKAKVLYTEKVNTMSYDVKGIPVRTTSVPSPCQIRLSLRDGL